MKTPHGLPHERYTVLAHQAISRCKATMDTAPIQEAIEQGAEEARVQEREACRATVHALELKLVKLGQEITEFRALLNMPRWREELAGAPRAGESE